MRKIIDFLIYDWLEIEQIFGRPRFADHSRDSWLAVVEQRNRVCQEMREEWS